jgi:hypothetical protein
LFTRVLALRGWRILPDRRCRSTHAFSKNQTYKTRHLPTPGTRFKEGLGILTNQKFVFSGLVVLLCWFF